MSNVLHQDFTQAAYRNMLQTALDSGYQFGFFDELEDKRHIQTCYLRHDIDVDLKAACKVGSIEADLGIASTYFVMLRSPVYNLFSRANHAFVEQLIEQGHRIALHFDENFSHHFSIPLAEQIEKELTILKSMFGVDTRVVSFHQPSERILSQTVALSNIVNTYDKDLFQGIHYVSDSNKIWKNEHPTQLFADKKYPYIQLLIHPMWWVLDENLPTREVWRRILVDSFYQRQEQIVQTERAYGGGFQMILKNLD